MERARYLTGAPVWTGGARMVGPRGLSQ